MFGIETVVKKEYNSINYDYQIKFEEESVLKTNHINNIRSYKN
jgi:hypothetical protein